MSWASRTTRTRKTKRAPPKITVAANAKPTLLGRRQKNKKVLHQEKKISRIRAFFYLVREDEDGILPRPFSGLFHLAYLRFNTPYFYHNYYTSSYRNMRGMMDSWAGCFAH